jgi:histidyl-tRNA synthetase
MPTIVKPTPVSGFPEFLPSEQILFAKVLDIIRAGFERYGFSPIETPAIERKEVLTSKAGIEKEIYALSRLAAEPDESPETDLALHFDLTVPLARYVAMYKDKLAFPFRRYQMQKVWRGEKAQSGRYREFYQCDIDVIGKGSLSLLTDAEIPSVIYQVFREMQIGAFVIRINNRKILQGFFRYLGISQEQTVEVMRLADKLEKIGSSQLANELSAKIGLDESVASKLIDFLGEKRSNEDMLTKLEGMDNINELFAEGVKELRIVVDGMRTLGVPDDHFRIDVGVARGLDYYTGTVYETVLSDYLGVGSICSGGRYDDLASYFTEEKLPGVGISIGATRLVVRLIEAGILKPGPATAAPVLVTTMDENRTGEYLRIGATLRDAGIPTEVFFEKARLGDQLRYANKKGFSIAIIAGDSEFLQNSAKIKNLVTGDETLTTISDLAQKVKDALSTSQ